VWLQAAAIASPASSSTTLSRPGQLHRRRLLPHVCWHNSRRDRMGHLFGRSAGGLRHDTFLHRALWYPRLVLVLVLLHTHLCMCCSFSWVLQWGWTLHFSGQDAHDAPWHAIAIGARNYVRLFLLFPLVVRLTLNGQRPSRCSSGTSSSPASESSRFLVRAGLPGRPCSRGRRCYRHGTPPTSRRTGRGTRPSAPAGARRRTRGTCATGCTGGSGACG
jgi:hypothetical protein